MIGKILKNMIKINIDIPYEGNLVYPTNSITKDAIGRYCAKENYEYEFIENNEDDNMRVNIAGKKYEVLRPFCGRGGYAITCRPL